ncbi:MAG: PKD domain-containing protein [Candidatus Thermoplasmatota archaeon]|nr:PKD domain-containing protein [Candidatus Thermoplasmatota archaeon]MDD5777981.1 PKD domain-containing protein [Candidatus Thermoplasmatota archaeon]
MTRKYVALAAAFATVLGAALLAGCLDQNAAEAKTSMVEIRVGDMPTQDFTSINVTFSEVKLYSNHTGWLSIATEPTTIDLLYLHMNNLTQQLGLTEVEVGNYSKLWIVVDNASGVLRDTNQTVYFDVPSGTLKIQHLFVLQEGNHTITVDIDLDNSVFARGDMYKLLPVISSLNVSYANGTQIHIRDRDRIRNMTENRPPAIDIVVNGSRGNHLSVWVNQTVVFNASGTFDIDSDTLTYHWDFDEGTVADTPVVEQTFTEKGTYQVTLTVSDGQLEATDRLTVTVKDPANPGGNNGQHNQPPRIDIEVEGVHANHLTVEVNQTIVFNASGTFDLENESLSLLWDFDDGTTATTPTVEHMFTRRDTYHVALTATDGSHEDTDRMTVTVRESKGGSGKGPT